MKVDFKKSLPAYRAKSGVFSLVELPRLRYVMIDGCGDPNTDPAYAHALAAIYPVAYTLKFQSKNALGRDYVVPPLEGLWWADDMTVFTSARDKASWAWTMMLMVPDWITTEMYDSAVSEVARKSRPERLDSLRLDELDEGRCVQTLHIGPYDAEAETLAEMHDRFIPSQGLQMRGKHHEIYLSDSRRAAPESLRTILRQPVDPARAPASWPLRYSTAAS